MHFVDEDTTRCERKMVCWTSDLIDQRRSRIICSGCDWSTDISNSLIMVSDSSREGLQAVQEAGYTTAFGALQPQPANDFGICSPNKPNLVRHIRADVDRMKIIPSICGGCCRI